MHNKHLLKSIIFSLIVVITLGIIVAINLIQKTASEQPVNTTPIANFQDESPTQVTRNSISLSTEKLATADYAQIVLAYTAAEPQTIIGLSLKILVDDYQPADASTTPFVLSDQLQQAGVTAQINKWSCEDQQPCSIDIALINVSPGGFDINPGQSLGLLKFDRTAQFDELSLKLDPEQTQALTLSGESVTIEFK